LPIKDKRRNPVMTYLTDSEMELFKMKVSVSGLSQAEFIRTRILNDDSFSLNDNSIKIPYDPLLAKLEEIQNGLQKTEYIHSKILAAILVESSKEKALEGKDVKTMVMAYYEKLEREAKELYGNK
jgi:hypothetical protein